MEAPLLDPHQIVGVTSVLNRVDGILVDVVWTSQWLGQDAELAQLTSAGGYSDTIVRDHALSALSRSLLGRSLPPLSSPVSPAALDQLLTAIAESPGRVDATA